MHGCLNTLKFAHITLTDVIKFVVPVQDWLLKWGLCSIIDLFSGSYQEDVKFMFW